jgi:RHS repeat-associated protein
MHLAYYHFHNPKNYLYSKPIKGLHGYGFDYRFAFNGKERDNETYGEGNAYDFGARIQDPRLGRWLSLDPMQSRYPDWSPYNYTMNSPITMIDPDGKYVVKSIKRYDANCKLIPAWKFWVKAKSVEIHFTVHNAKLYNGSSQEASPDIMQKAAEKIQTDITETFRSSHVIGEERVDVTVSFATPIEVITSLKGVVTESSRSDNLIYIADHPVVEDVSNQRASAFAPLGSNLMVLDVDEGFIRDNPTAHTPAHEFGHQMGLSKSSSTKHSPEE